MPVFSGGYAQAGIIDPAADQFLVDQGGVIKKALGTQVGLLANTASLRTFGGPDTPGGKARIVSTPNATKGLIEFGAAATTVYDEVSDRIGSGTNAPAYGIHAMSGSVQLAYEGTTEAILRAIASGSGGRQYEWISAATASGLGVGFHLYDRTAVARRLHLDDAGNFGLGAAAAASTRMLLSDPTESILRIVASGAGGRAYEWISAATASGLGVGFHLYDRTAAANRLSVNASGQVGIGTASPGELLDVFGNVYISTQTAVQGIYAKDSGGVKRSLLTWQSNIGGPVTLNAGGSGTWTGFKVATLTANTFGIDGTTGTVALGPIDGAASIVPSANGANVLMFFGKTVDPTLNANNLGGGLYAKLVSGVYEMFARGSDNTGAQLSCHHPVTKEPILHHHVPGKGWEIIYWSRVVGALEAIRDGRALAHDLVLREPSDLCKEAA
jgi:hypothetical protein